MNKRFQRKLEILKINIDILFIFLKQDKDSHRGFCYSGFLEVWLSLGDALTILEYVNIVITKLTDYKVKWSKFLIAKYNWNIQHGLIFKYISYNIQDV